MSRKPDLDTKRVLELLKDGTGTPKDVAARLGASPEAVDEARCLLEEIGSAESDAILAMPPVLARALLRAAALAGRHEVLLEAASATDRELQREARRIAHALEQRGVKVELPAKAREEVAPRSAEPAPAADLPVFLSSLDPAGERAVFWSRALPGRGVELTQLLVGERGVMEMAEGEMSRRRFRELSRELPRRGVVTIVEVPRAVGRVVIDRARVAGRDGGEIPARFTPWAAQVLGPVPADAPPPLRPEGEGRPPPEELGALARRSAELLDVPELKNWLPDDENALRACALAVEEANRSQLYLEGELGESQRADALAAAVERAVEGYFDERRRSTYAARLLDMGWLLERTGRIEPARIAAAAAQALAAGAPLAAIPLCRELFARVFLRNAPQAPAPDRAASLIVDPAAGGEERPSGIIVPE
jgi:hypothetical protein